MIRYVFLVNEAAPWLVLVAVVLLLATIGAIVVERIALAWNDAWHRRLEARYRPVIVRASSGDDDARRELAALPRRARIGVARLVILPLIDDREPGHVAAARQVIRAIDVLPLANRYLHSRWWWRRVLALRVFGLIQAWGCTGAIVAALDDRHADVRGAALDALCDSKDPASLPAVIARIDDQSLHVGRRAAAIAAFGVQCEPLVLALADTDPGRRLSCARALSICGTAVSRPALREWAADRRADVRVAALEALAHIGLDRPAAAVALAALESGVEAERAVAAAALSGWTGEGDTASRLAAHLDDAWTVAVQAARSLQRTPGAGHLALETCATRPDLAGRLARQMLWEAQARC